MTKLLTFTVENYNNESISLFQLSIYFKILFSSGPDLGPDHTISFINFLSYNKIAHCVIRYCIWPTSILNWWQCKQQFIMRNCRFNLITQTAEPELNWMVFLFFLLADGSIVFVIFVDRNRSGGFAHRSPGQKLHCWMQVQGDWRQRRTDLSELHNKQPHRTVNIHWTFASKDTVSRPAHLCHRKKYLMESTRKLIFSGQKPCTRII